MMYPFMTLDDKTEIVHSDLKENGTVKVYIEKPIYGGFHSAECYLPDYEWKNIQGFNDKEMQYWDKFVKANAHLIIEFSTKGGFLNASEF